MCLVVLKLMLARAALDLYVLTLDLGLERIYVRCGVEYPVVPERVVAYVHALADRVHSESI